LPWRTTEEERRVPQVQPGDLARLVIAETYHLLDHGELLIRQRSGVNFCHDVAPPFFGKYFGQTQTPRCGLALTCPGGVSWLGSRDGPFPGACVVTPAPDTSRSGSPRFLWQSSGRCVAEPASCTPALFSSGASRTRLALALDFTASENRALIGPR